MNEANNDTSAVRRPPKGGSAKKDAGRLDAFAGRTASGGGDWGTCDERWIAAVVVAITGLGGAVTFSLSRDLEAHSLTLMLDKNRKTLWFDPDADLTEKMEEVYRVLAEID